jgi:hypothetical protein
LSLTSDINLNLLAKILKSCRAIEKLEYQPIKTESDTHVDYPLLSNLREIKLSNLSWKNIFDLINQCPALVDLNVPKDDMRPTPQELSQYPSVKKLNIGTLESISETSRLLAAFPNVETLNLTGRSNHSFAEMIFPPTVKHLNLFAYYRENLDWNTLAKIIRSCPLLEQ